MHNVHWTLINDRRFHSKWLNSMEKQTIFSGQFVNNLFIFAIKCKECDMGFDICKGDENVVMFIRYFVDFCSSKHRSYQESSSYCGWHQNARYNDWWRCVDCLSNPLAVMINVCINAGKTSFSTSVAWNHIDYLSLINDSWTIFSIFPITKWNNSRQLLISNKTAAAVSLCTYGHIKNVQILNHEIDKVYKEVPFDQGHINCERHLGIFLSISHQ